MAIHDFWVVQGNLVALIILHMPNTVFTLFSAGEPVMPITCFTFN